MPSITTWTRLEPQTRRADFREALQAQVHDPLWLLARQWQLGEFRGEDAASPVVATLGIEDATISRFQAGPLRPPSTFYWEDLGTNALWAELCSSGMDTHLFTINEYSELQHWRLSTDSGDLLNLAVLGSLMPNSKPRIIAMGEQVHVIGNLSTGELAHRRFSGEWTEWQILNDDSVIEAIPLTLGTTGKLLQVVVFDSRGIPYYRIYDDVWSAWEPLNTEGLRLATAVATNETIYLIAIDFFGTLVSRTLTTEWQRQAEGFASANELRAFSNEDQVHLFITIDGHVYHVVHGLWVWQWTAIAPLSSLALLADDGKLHLFYVTRAGEFTHQQYGHGQWSSAIAVSVVTMREITGLPTATGIRLYGIDSFGRLLRGLLARTGRQYSRHIVPLETLVERESVRQRRSPDLRLAAEAGLYFLRMMEAAGAGGYRQGFRAAFPLHLPPELDPSELDEESIRYLRMMGGRVPDGLQLYLSLRTGILPSLPAIAEADRPVVQTAVRTWLDWYETIFSEPAPDEGCWQSNRLEYQFSIGTRTSSSEQILTATEYAGGHLDWYSFDIEPTASLGTTTADGVPTYQVKSVVPTPVRFRGMPAPRWWEFEDAAVDLGALDSAPEDLAKLLLMEFVLLYGNDWFVIPVEVNIGSLSIVRWLTITNTFGEAITIPRSDQVDGVSSPWRMFQLSHHGADRMSSSIISDAQNALFVPAVLLTSQVGRPLEDVRFVRDEMANMAWAIERTVQSVTGRPVERDETSRRGPAPTPSPTNGDMPTEQPPVRYKLMNGVPPYWIPLVPVELLPGNGLVRLQRGAMIQEGKSERIQAKGDVLMPDRPLNIFEEEVPRSGVRVTRAFQHARWIDGSTHLWLGCRKQVGRGEGSSGLRFDNIEPV